MTPAQLPLDLLKGDLDAITQIYEQRRLTSLEGVQPSVAAIYRAYLLALEDSLKFLFSLIEFLSRKSG